MTTGEKATVKKKGVSSKPKAKKKGKAVKKGNTGNKGGQLENKNAEKWTEKKAIDLGKQLLKWLDLPPEIDYTEKGSRTTEKANVFYKSFLASKDLDDDSITYLKSKFKSFSDLIKIAKLKQEARLLDFGCTNIINPTMAIFVLKSYHGKTDRVDVTTNGNDLSSKVVDVTHLGVKELKQLHEGFSDTEGG